MEDLAAPVRVDSSPLIALHGHSSPIEKTSAWPTKARICVWFTYAQIVFNVLTHMFWRVGPQMTRIPEQEIEVFNTVQLALVPTMLAAVIFFISEQFCRNPQRPAALMMSRLVIFECFIKIAYYTVLAKYNGGFAHVNLRAFGPERPIYLPRWIGWSLAIPTLIAMNTYPMMDTVPFPVFFRRILPMQAATMSYCWSCYLGCIIYDPWMGWFLISLGCMGYVSIIADQAVFVAQRLCVTENAAAKGYSVIVKEMVFATYTSIWLLGNWGYCSSLVCQKFYSYGDVSLKASMTLLMFIFWNIKDGAKPFRET